MADTSENVILFPRWRKALEDESLSAIKEERYADALENINELIHFGVSDQEINIGRLICLIELKHYEEAQDFCENLLDENDGYYYDYFHVYVTILFQTSQYELLINLIEREMKLGHIPEEMKSQFYQLYQISQKLIIEDRNQKTSEYIKKLFQSIENKKYVQQYSLIQELRQMGAPPPENICPLLMDNRAHPLAKTAISQWLKENDWEEEIRIHKFNQEKHIIPDQIENFETHPVLQGVLQNIDDIEQNNPTLYQMMKQLLYHFLYVRYPVMPYEDDVHYIASALQRVSEGYLALQPNQSVKIDEKVKQYIEEIEVFEAVYSSILDN